MLQQVMHKRTIKFPKPDATKEEELQDKERPQDQVISIVYLIFKYK